MNAEIEDRCFDGCIKNGLDQDFVYCLVFNYNIQREVHLLNFIAQICIILGVFFVIDKGLSKSA